MMTAREKNSSALTLFVAVTLVTAVVMVVPVVYFIPRVIMEIARHRLTGVETVTDQGLSLIHI